MNQRFRFPLIIPPDIKISVKLGDKIEAGQAIGQSIQGQALTINVSTQLGILPKEIGKYLQIPIGNEIKSGEIIASRKTAFSKKQVVSPHAGKVQSISAESGSITLALRPDSQSTFKSPVGGEVVAIALGLVEVGVSGKIYEAVKVGELVGWGCLDIIDQGETIKIESLSVNQSGKIVVSADKINQAWLSKAAALDIAGVVCAGFQNEEIGVKIPFVYLSQGESQLDRHLWEKLTADAGKIALISPKEKILGIIDR